MHTKLRVICLASLLLASPAGHAWSAQGDCGQPRSAGDEPTATDALATLRAAVAIDFCVDCVCDYNGSGTILASDALLVLLDSAGRPTVPACPTCDPGGQCPDIAQFTIVAGTRGPCVEEADCGGVGTCDPSIGRCVTASKFESGWTGLAHGSDVNDTVPSRLRMACDAAEAPCGRCQIVGLDPLLRNCRCANDTRTACFEPFRPDQASCGGDDCVCFFGVPTPRSSGNVPTCGVSRILGVSGDANVDTGSGTISLALRSDVALGESLFAPCPYCDGDGMPGDGMPDGLCVGGESDGLPCDAQSGNTTFPAPTGGRNSLDCLPSEGKLVTGSGILTNLDIRTGTTSLGFDLDCTTNPLLGEVSCPCLVCSGDPNRACTSDAVCERLGAGTCSSIGGGVAPRENQCEEGLCVAVGDDRGQCQSGPIDRFCDGIVRANQRGFISCTSDESCAESSIGVDAGLCTIEELRPCFLDPVVAQGTPHPFLPIGAAALCAPPTENNSVNSVAGLPGPTRVTYQTVLQEFCTADPQSAPYVPGAGMCL